MLNENTSGEVSVELTAELSSPVTIPVTVSGSVTGRGTGSYTIGDLKNPSSISFTIPARTTTSSPFKITALPDDDRAHQFITLALDWDKLPSSVLPSVPHSVQIGVRDDNPPIPKVQVLEVVPNPVPEGSAVSVVLLLSDVQPVDVTIPLTLTAGTAEAGDYGTLARITIPAAHCCATGHIATVRDADDEDETFTVALGSSLPAPVEAGSPASALVTISEGSGAPPGTGGPGPEGGGQEPPSVSLPAANPVTEGASVTVTARLSAALPEDVDIPVRVERDTSEEDDHGTLASIRIRSGARHGTGTIETMQDDDTDDETFMVELGESLPSTVTMGSPDSVKITITDDDQQQPPGGNGPPGGGGAPPALVDAPTVSLAATPNPVTEGNPVTVTATLAAALSEAVTIPLTLAAGTAEADDYGPLASITISSGETSGTGTITTATDADTEDETFTVALDSLPATVSAGSPDSVEVTITDTTIPAVQLSVAPNPVPEGSSVTVTATLAAALSNDETIPLTLTAGTAEAGDYGPLASITISGGATSGTGTITTTADADTEDETFTVALGSLPATVSAGSPDSVEVTISDATIPAVQLSAAPNPVPEGSSVTVTATLAATFSEAVRIPLNVRRGTSEAGDHGTLGSITIGSGTTNGTGTITTAADDDTDDETFTVVLGSLPATVSAGSPSSVAVTIKDTTTTLTLDADREPAEGGPAVTVTATLSNPAPANGTAVRLAVSGTATRDTGAGAGGDYRLSSTMISIAAGATAGTVTITVTDDADDDDGETIVLAATSDDTPALAARLTLTITDNDEAPIPPSTDASLSSLQLSEGTLEPRFAAATQSYTAEVAHEVASVTVTPTVRDSRATVTVNGAAVASGSASDPISLREGGETTIAVEVTAEDAVTTRTYTVRVTRADLPPSTDASLSDLQLSEGTLEPRFAAATQSYTAEVAHEVASVTVTPTVRDSRATVTVNGAAVASGSASDPISLREGGETTIAVEVTAEDAVTTRTYTVRVTRADLPPSTDASLSDLQLSEGTLEPRFAAATQSYTAEVAHEVASVTVTPTVRDSRATVTVNGAAVVSGSASDPISLEEGSETIIAVKVTAEDAVTTRTYTVRVTRAAAEPMVTEKHREQRLQVGLAGLGRTVAASAVSVIGQRLAPATQQAGAEADLAGVDLTLNRRALRLPAADDTAAGGRLAQEALQALGVSVTPAGKLSVVPISDVELLSGSAFGAHQGAVPGWGFWGSGAASGFHGEVDEFEQEGGVLAGYLGADYRFGAGVLAGLAASYHNLELSVTSSAAGAADLTGGVVNVYPYGFWMPAEWLGLWAVVGFGAGGAEVAEQNAGASEEGELGSWLGAAGQRVEFLSGGGLSLAAKADGFVTGLTAGGGLPAVSAHAWRARALLEGGLEWHAPDTRLAGRVELGGRLDGGDAEQGLGVEAGAQVSYTHTGIGLGIGGRGRLLLVHEDQAIRDWGASATLRWEPAGPGTGPALSAAPAWGRVASGPGVLWQDQPLAQELVSSAGATAGEVAPWLPDSVALRLSYGLEVAAGAGRVRPYAEVGLDPAQVRRVRAGTTVDLSPAGAAPGGVRLEAFGQRTALFGGGAEYRLGLEGALEY